MLFWMRPWRVAPKAGRLACGRRCHVFRVDTCDEDCEEFWINGLVECLPEETSFGRVGLAGRVLGA